MNNIDKEYDMEELKQIKQGYGFRKWIFWITAVTATTFAVVSTGLVAWAFITPELLNIDLRYIVISYMCIMTIEIIALLHILGSLSSR